MAEVILVGRPGQKPQRCRNTPDALAIAASRGLLPISEVTESGPPSDIVLVSGDGGRTVDRCRRDSLHIAAAHGLMPVAAGSKADAAEPEIVRPRKKAKKK